VIGCEESMRVLWQYLDETASGSDRDRVEEHLARCRACCGELEFIKELRSFLSKAADEDLPEDVLRRLTETIEELGL